MSLRLLIDEDYQAKYLVNLLREAGHDVVTINDIKMAGTPDNQVFEYAYQHDRVILTRNCEDFRELHDSRTSHAGVFVVYEGDDSAKNMTYKAVVQAIANIEVSDVEISNQLMELNQWCYLL